MLESLSHPDSEGLELNQNLFHGLFVYGSTLGKFNQVIMR